MKNRYALCKLVYGPIGKASWKDIGPSFENPDSVIAFVQFNHGDETGRIEVSEFDADGDVIESVSYEDFASFYPSQGADKLAEQFERHMEDFAGAVAVALEAIKAVADEATLRIEQRMKAAIVEMNKAADPVLYLKTGEQVIETDLRHSDAIGPEQDETPMNPVAHTISTAWTTEALYRFQSRR